MAGVRRGWTKALLVAALLLTAGAGSAARAQSKETGSLAGRLTDLHSAPLDGATVVVRNEATGAELRTTTGRNGSYRFAGLEAGEYTLGAESERLGTGRLEGIEVAAGHEARLQTAMQFEPAAPKTISIQSAMHVIDAARLGSHLADAELSARNSVSHSADANLSPGIPENTAVMAGEPPVELALAGKLQAELLREMPATITPVVTAVVALEPLQELALTGAELIQHSASPVRAAAQDVDPVTPMVTTTLTEEQLQRLPVSGRRWQDFVLDTPTAATVAGGGQQTSLRGAGQEPADSTVDGASTRLAFGGSGSGSESGGSSSGSGAESGGIGQAWAGGRGFALGEMAIREVQTVAGNVEAEGARAAGGRMNVETARGVNGLHGQGFLFDRQNVWGAQNPFTQWVKETAAATEITTPTFTPEPYTPPDHETTWGVGLGSQLRRDKLFWFAALDGYNRNDPGLATVKHPDMFFAQPSNDQMQVLSARLGLSGTNPVAAGLAAYSKMLETLDGLLGPSPRTAAQWVGFARLDWQAAERHRFTIEGIGATWDSPGGGFTRVSESYGSNSFGASKASEEWLLGRWEAFVTPNLLAVSQGSAGRTIQSAQAETPSAFEKTFLAPSVWGQLPQIVVDSRYGLTIGNPSRFGQGSYPDERLYEGQEKLDWVRGSLLVKAGFDLSHNSDATSLLRNQTGTYYYSSVENFASDALAFSVRPKYIP